ncbi:MAG: ROK family protein [Oscillospiraceae bacterium]|nr:ROK family protein [Oscillospiraceae bacterium]
MYYLGVDLGGTNIAVGLVSEAGVIEHKGSVPTLSQRPSAEVIADMAGLCKKVVADAGKTMDDIAAVGIAVPGLSIDETGEVVFATNLGWHHVQIGQAMSKELGKPVHMDNDANVAALGEVVAGGMKGAKNAIFLTLGTGVGGGIVLDGKIFGGAHHVGGEVGHMIVKLGGEQCTCGNKGCWERYTSATALIREGRKAAEAHPESLIAKKVNGNLDAISAKTVIDAARENDPEACRIYKDYIEAMALGIVSLINLFDPETIAIGGGVAAAGDFLLEPLRACVAEHVFYKDEKYASIVRATLGNDAGIIGAAIDARNKELA